jgi:hypothetical protein
MQTLAKVCVALVAYTPSSSSSMVMTTCGDHDHRGVGAGGQYNRDSGASGLGDGASARYLDHVGLGACARERAAHSLHCGHGWTRASCMAAWRFSPPATVRAWWGPRWHVCRRASPSPSARHGPAPRGRWRISQEVCDAPHVMLHLEHLSHWVELGL